MTFPFYVQAKFDPDPNQAFKLIGLKFYLVHFKIPVLKNDF